MQKKDCHKRAHKKERVPEKFKQEMPLLSFVIFCPFVLFCDKIILAFEGSFRFLFITKDTKERKGTGEILTGDAPSFFCYLLPSCSLL
jgi:hypothetical protein